MAVSAPAPSSNVSSRANPGRRRRASRRVATAWSAIVILANVVAGCSAPRIETSDGHTFATVERVVDGDTVVLRIGAKREIVRLVGVNTPETVKPNSPVECFGPEASAFTKSFLPHGTVVLVKRDAEARDKYGRLLLYVWRRDDGAFVNMELVMRGYARTLSIEPNTTFAGEFSRAAIDARNARRGLWSACGG